LANAESSTPPTPDLKVNPWLVLVVVNLGFFMVLLDTTIVNIAIPNMVDGLKASLDQILWVLNAYILVIAVLLITAGRLGDMFGPKLLFNGGLAVFTLASAACSLAQDPNQLIIARIIQGVGAAMLTPQSLSFLTAIFPPHRRGAAFGVWGAVAGLATITGPTLGGLLVTLADWRAVFWVNVPIGLIALMLSIKLVPNLRLNRRHRLDVVGVLLATVGLFLGVFALVEGQRFHWGTLIEFGAFDAAGGHWGLISIPTFLLVSLVVMGLFLWWERQQDEPLVPLGLFQNRNFAVANLIMTMVAFGMLGLFLPMVIFLQSVLGMSALKAGLTMAPASLASMVVAPIAGRLADRFGGKYILMFGLTLFAAGFGMMVQVASLAATPAVFILPLIVAGIGMGCTFAPTLTVAMRRIDPRQAGAASGVLNTMRQLGAALGSAVVGAVLQAQLATQLREEALRQSVALPEAYRSRFVGWFSNAAGSGLEVGPAQTAGGPSLPQGVPPDVVVSARRLARVVFDEAYLRAMRPSLVLPLVVLLLSAATTLLLQRRQIQTQRDAAAAEAGAAGA
jgi:EmrB/QacA subfamily drug resistance transporter